MDRIYEPLTAPGPNGTVAPWLATSWKTTSPTTWQFTLRSGVRFTSGRLMTSDDVVESFNQYKKGGRTATWGPIQSARAVDDSTVEFVLSRPFPALPAGFMSLRVLSGIDFRNGTGNPDKGQFIGTGPWIIDNHVPDVEWDLSRNPNYWGQKTQFANLKVKIIKDENARIAALKSGAVDFITVENVDARKILSGVSHVAVEAQQSADFYLVYLNGVNPAAQTKNQLLRQAISAAIDRDQLNAIALGGSSKPVGPTPPQQVDSCPLPSGYNHADPARAQALLAQAGLTNVSVTDLIATGLGVPAIPELAQVLQQQLAKAGITSDIKSTDVGGWATPIFNTNPAKFDISVAYRAGYSDPTVMVGPYALAAAAPQYKNFTAPDADLDQLVIQAQATAPGPARAQLLQKACQRILDDANTIPLLSLHYTTAYRTDRVKLDFQSYEPNFDMFRYLANFAPVS